MANYQFSQKQFNIFLKILIGLTVIFAVLIVAHYYFGFKVLKNNDDYIKSLMQKMAADQTPSLTAPISKTTDPRLGPSTAQNILVEYSDFQCPYCADLTVTLSQLLKDKGNDILLVWKDMPNPDHPQARNAAIAARCAGEQDKFWEYHDYLFANQSNLSDNTYNAIAKSINLDLSKFNQCYSAQATANLVDDATSEALALQIDKTGTPYLFINNQAVTGSMSLADLEKMLK